MGNPAFELLTPGAGYGIVIGLGVGFAFVMVALTLVQNRYGTHNTFKSTEEFNAASRSIKPGMIAAGIVSSWTHASTLLTSCTLAFSYGVSGGLWYGAFGTFQTLLFAVTAFKIKEQSNNAHTFPEIVLQKHGRHAHKVYTCFGIFTNLINGSALLAGGCGVWNALTGMDIWASYWILVVVVTAYIVVGGLRSTFICDYLHTIFLFICIFIFMFQVYAVNPAIGSPRKLYELLRHKTADSYNGSFMTVKSRDGLVNGIDIWLAGFSAVWTDQAYWQRAIASQPATAVKGYLLGSFAWYAIPFAMSTTLGLAAAAMQDTVVFPYKLTTADINNGLDGPAAAIALMGKSGAALMVVLLFMAVTSSTSAESIACSSLITFDVYKAYINPLASTRRLLWVSILGLAIYGCLLASISCVFHSVGISLNWLIKILGCLLGGGSIPMACILLWKKTSTVAAVCSPIIGLTSGLIGWMVTTHVRSGSISITTTGDATNSLAGDCISLGMGGCAVVVLSILFPSRTKEVIVTELDDLTPQNLATSGSEKHAEVKDTKALDQEMAATEPHVHVVEENVEAEELKPILEEPYVPQNALTPEQVKSQKRLALVSIFVGTMVFCVILPFTLYGTGYTFSVGFFYGYVIVAFIWVWASFIICALMPLWESRKEIWYILGAMVRDVTGQKMHFAE
ncbi:solute symporter family transporter [Rhizodiscina lignyota]|uniref:Solute symporter family transporter n=1 Tax=Rhizodiscina lignyota TaxID=1504668 RepID=A0A9P4IB27_9PEZI|nr:solute symporter family transporter [Rhizodiscina lignyota]